MSDEKEPRFLTEDQWRREHVGCVARWTWMAFLIVEAVDAVITLAATLDVTLSLGWGYSWTAVLVGFGILAWGDVVYLGCRAVFRLIGHGPL